MTAVYFDLDDTLVGGHVLAQAADYARRRSPARNRHLRLIRLLADIPSLILAELRGREHFNHRLYRHLEGVPEQELRSLAEAFLQRHHLSRLFPATPGVLEAYRERGFRIVLVTGSLETTVAPLAEELGVCRVIGNRLAFRDGIATGEILLPVVAGSEKAVRVREDAEARGLPLERCHAWSDSAADLPMLEMVGRAHVVRPGRRLAREARARGWPIHDMSRSLEPEALGLDP